MTTAPPRPTLGRYAERIAALADDGPAIAAIADGGGWTRTYGRLQPGAEPYALMVFERGADVVRVEAWDGRPPHSPAVRDETIGWLRAARLPDDARLPALPALFAAAGSPVVLRYRPYSRCTVRVDGPEGPRFAKVFCDGQAPRVHLEGRAVFAAAERGELGFAVPRPGRFDEQTGVIWVDPVAGIEARPRLLSPSAQADTADAPRGAALAARMGVAAASLPLSGIRPLRAIGREVAFSKLARRAGELARLAPVLAERVHGLLADLRGLHAGVPQAELRPVHGDLNLGQWLVDGERLALVDFEDLSLGEPERDAGVFLAELDPERAPDAAAAFLAGYESLAGPLDRRLVAAYAALKTIRKSQQAAQALDRSGEQRAAARLDRAARWIAGEWP